MYEKLFTPVKIGSLTIKNRFAMAPMGPLGLSDSEGGFNQRGIDYYVERAKGGTGLIITGVTFSDCEVEKPSMPNCPNSTYNPVHFIRTGREMTERVHAYGSKIFLMMSGGFGRVTIPTNLGEFPPVAPSEIPHRWLDKTCRALTVEEIHSIVKSFGDGAYNAKRAGFDGVEIHAVHEGYLLDQFAISMFNLRTDEYGGSLENRLRFAREVVEEIKSRCGQDFPVALRFSVKSMIKDWRVGALPGEEFEEKGRDIILNQKPPLGSLILGNHPIWRKIILGIGILQKYRNLLLQFLETYRIFLRHAPGIFPCQNALNDQVYLLFLAFCKFFIAFRKSFFQQLSVRRFYQLPEFLYLHRHALPN